MTSKERALDIAHRLSAMQASEILVFDLREVSSFTDYFVIASGTSTRHVKSLAGETTQAVREQGEQTLGVEGDPPGRWMLVDAGDVTCGFKAFRADAGRELFSLARLHDWSFDAEILFLAARRRLRVRDVPLRWSDRAATTVRLARATPRSLVRLPRTHPAHIVDIVAVEGNLEVVFAVNREIVTDADAAP